MKKVLIAVLMIVIGFFVFRIIVVDKSVPEGTVYRYEFEEPLDLEFWLVSPWDMYKQMPEIAPARDGLLSLEKTKNGVEPYLLTKPLALTEGDVITLKRRVKISRGTEYFAGGVAMYQTDDTTLLPEKTDGAFATTFGDGVFLVEYSYDLKAELERPGRDIFRFLAADWSYNDNYVLIPPVYDEWIEETFTFDTRSNQMFYAVNGKSYKLNSFKLDKGNVRFMIHAYGKGSGNQVEMDWIEINIENKRVTRKG